MAKQQPLFHPTAQVERPAFPTPTRPLAKTTDLPSSQAASTAMRGSKRLGDLQRRALELVLAYPGSTANELAHAYARTRESDEVGTDSRTIPRRLRELERANYLLIAGTRMDSVTGKSGVCWWPTQKAKEWMTGNV